MQKVLEQIIDGTLEDPDQVDAEVAKHLKPLNFIGPNSFELEYERGFEELCINLSTFISRDVKKLNVKEFYALLSHAKKSSKRNSTPRGHTAGNRGMDHRKDSMDVF